MAYSEQVLRRAQARLAQEKANCEAEAAARTEQIYRQFPQRAWPPESRAGTRR